MSCGCTYFPNGVPPKFKVTLSGLSGSCGSCSSLDGDYICDLDGSQTCGWKYTFPGGAACNALDLTVSIAANLSGGYDLFVTLNIPFGSNQWKLENIKSAQEASYTPTSWLPGDCDASSVTVTPIAFTRNSTDAPKWACLPTQQPGPNPPGTGKNPFAMPVLSSAVPSASGGDGLMAMRGASPYAMAPGGVVDVSAELPPVPGGTGSLPYEPPGGGCCGTTPSCGCDAGSNLGDCTAVSVR